MTLLEGINMPNSSSLVVPAGACIIGGVLGGIIMKKAIIASGPVDKLPEKWVKVGKIENLFIYPVKGMPGISVREASLENLGLKGVENPLLRDRVFGIINEQGKFFSLQKLPMLALTRVKIDGNKVHLTHVKDPSLSVTFEIPNTSPGNVDPSKVKVAKLYGENVKGIDCGDDVAAWLSRLSETSGLRMIYHVEEETQRGAPKRNTRFHTYRGSHTGSFQDETSYMLMTDESVAAVNTHLEKPVSVANFRPGIFVNEISEPFAEDFWGYIRIGDKNNGPVLKASRPCARCVVTTVDPETGTVRTDGEPLKTLYKLKRPVGDEKITKLVQKSAIMGSHFGMFQGTSSVVKVGDPIYAALV